MDQVGEPLDFGGILDTVTCEIVGPSKTPLQWFCSEAQLPAILHDPKLLGNPTKDGQKPASRILCYGAEGAGKSQILAMWTYLQVLDLLGFQGYFGVTAPTHEQLAIILNTLRWYAPICNVGERMPNAWGFYHAKRREIDLACGITLQLRATRGNAGAKAGSPIQGFDWARCASDEYHETAEQGRDPDIEARLRAAPSGLSKRLCACTAKDTTKWRNHRDGRLATGDWVIHRLPARTNPFVFPEHWNTLERNLSAREKLRRMDAMDVAPERATYYNWDRDQHVSRIPDLAEDVTTGVLTGYESYLRPGGFFSAVLAHDPGELKQTSTLLKLYLIRRIPTWIVVGEFVTQRCTPEQHAAKAKIWLQERWGLNHDADKFDPDRGIERAMVIRDPHVRERGGASSEVDAAFIKHGLDIFSAAPEKQVIKVKDRVEMVNRLLKHSDGRIRLQVAKGCGYEYQGAAKYRGEDSPEFQNCPCMEGEGKSCAPSVVQGMEELERALDGRPETGKKGPEDLTHACVTVGYGLWLFEREIMTEFTQDAALAASKRRYRR